MKLDPQRTPVQRFAERMRSGRGLGSLVMVKIVVVLCVIAALRDEFSIGQRPSVAATDKEAPTDKPAKNPVVASAQDEPKRRSFLDDLLNLPTTDPSELKKEEFGQYLAIAERKKRQIDERLELLKKRESQLVALESAIDARLVKMEEERKFFQQTTQREKDLKGERLERLVELYGKMEPRKAAPIFETLDKDLVVAMFSKLQQKQVTRILEGMSAEKSRELSEYYGRVRSAREYELLKDMNLALKDMFADCRGMPTEKSAETKASQTGQTPANSMPSEAGPLTAMASSPLPTSQPEGVAPPASVPAPEAPISSPPAPAPIAPAAAPPQNP